MSAQRAAHRRGGYRRQFHSKVWFAKNAEENAGRFESSACAVKRAFVGHFTEDNVRVGIELVAKSPGGFNRGVNGLNGALGDREVAAGNDVQVRRVARVSNLRERLHADILAP